MAIYATLANYLRSYGIPVLISIGIVSNTMSFLVLKRMKASSTAYFMSFLGLVDTCVLLTGAFSIWLHYTNLESSPFISLLGCKLTMFVFYTFADFSVLIIVIMTAERFYGVWKPVHKNEFTNKRLILITSFLFCFLLNSHLIFTHSNVEYTESSESIYNFTVNQSFTFNIAICEFVVWKEFYEKYWIFIDATIYSFIPFVAITVLNVLLIRLLNRAEKMNKQLITRSKNHPIFNRRNSCIKKTRSSGSLVIKFYNF